MESPNARRLADAWTFRRHGVDDSLKCLRHYRRSAWRATDPQPAAGLALRMELRCSESPPSAPKSSTGCKRRRSLQEGLERPSGVAMIRTGGSIDAPATSIRHLRL